MKTILGRKNLSVFALHNDIVTVVFDKPDNDKVNILCPQTMHELAEAVELLEGLAAQGKLKAIIFVSGKSQCFIAGADINALVKLQDAPMEEVFSGCQDGAALFARIERFAAELHVPSIACVHGACFGGGLELALACSTILASDDKVTKFGLPEPLLGLLAGWNGNVRLAQRLGFLPAFSLILNPFQPWSARKALNMGLATELMPAAALGDRALELARLGAPISTGKGSLWRTVGNTALVRHTVLGVAEILKVITQLDLVKFPFPGMMAAVEVTNAVFDQGPAAASRLESKRFAELIAGPACRKGVATFLGRKDKKLPLPEASK